MNTYPKTTYTNPNRALSHPEQSTDTNIIRGNNRLIHGDCIQVLSSMPNASVDMVVTDPPYLVSYRDRSGRTIINDDNPTWLWPAFLEVYRVMKPNTYCLSFYGWGHADRFVAAWKDCGFRIVAHIVWVKGYASDTRYVQSKHESAYLLAKGHPFLPDAPPADIQPWTYSGNRLHPTQKPVDALVPFIKAYSKAGDVILDPFAGSGTTGVAALRSNRRFTLIEKDAAYYQAARQRLNARNPA